MKMLHSRRHQVAPACLVIGALTASLVACHKDPQPPQTNSAITTTDTKKHAPIPDADIAKAIQSHLQEEGLLHSSHVQTSVTQGIATLTGSVDNLLAKQRAVEVVETMKGVRAVVDQVLVTPDPRTDDQLRNDVTTALHRDSATRPYSIAVDAKDGKVTLSGVADSWQQKSLYGDVAKTVRGLKALDNKVSVHYVTTRPGSEIEADVKHRIGDDVWLDESPLGVTVTGQTVHLSGVVGSAAQKSRARLDGWVAGVDSVDDSGIVVDWFALDEKRQAADYVVKTDSEIAEAVRDAFKLDPRLKTLVPAVTVKDGVVALSGSVESSEARRSAESDAKDTVGVWRVHDDVLVQPGGKLSDSDVERGVKRALSEDLLLPEGKSLGVSSAKGKVALTGTVKSGFDRFDAIADVGSVPGVAEIDDNLTIKRPPSDIKTIIEDRMYWDPMVQRDRVTVAVGPDGVATLTGTLDAWSEIRAAGDDALWGGATRVVNSLKLKKHPEVTAR